MDYHKMLKPVHITRARARVTRYAREQCGRYDKSRDKQYAPHEPLVREAALVVGTSKGFATSRPSHVDDDEP
jgi:hypothetical protein